MVAGQPGDGVVLPGRAQVDPEQWAAAVLVGGDHQRGPVAGPARRGGPPVPARCHRARCATGERDQDQVGARRDLRGGDAFAQRDDGPPVRADPGRGVLVAVVVGEVAVLPGRGVDHDQARPPGAVAVRAVPAGHHRAAVGGDLERGLVQRAARRRGEVLPGVGVPGPGQEQPFLGRAEVVVPVPHRVAGVQDRGDLALGARCGAARPRRSWWHRAAWGRTRRPSPRRRRRRPRRSRRAALRRARPRPRPPGGATARSAARPPRWRRGRGGPTGTAGRRRG